MLLLHPSQFAQSNALGIDGLAGWIRKTLDASGAGTANGTQIIQWTYGGGANQQWAITDTGSGNYKIIGVQSGRALDVSGGGTANGTKVQLWDYYSNTAQLYKLTSTEVGAVPDHPELRAGLVPGCERRLHGQWRGGSTLAVKRAGQPEMVRSSALS
jgi:hypothetical protein